MPELNRDNEKLIRKCCNYPKISTVALLMSFVLCGIIIPLEMIDDLVFHNDGFQPTGLYTIIAMIVIYMVIFCYCTLKVKFIMHGKKWTALRNALQVRQESRDRSGQIAASVGTMAAGRLASKSDNSVVSGVGTAMEVAGAVGTVATAVDMLGEAGNNAEAMATAYGVTIPSIRGKLIAFALIPLLVAIGIYIPQYVDGSRAMQEQATASAKAVNDVKSALETVCEQVSADDPTEEYRDRYRVIGYLKESGRDVITSRVNVTIEDGKISEIFYRGDVDEKVGLSENLERVQAEFSTLRQSLLSSPSVGSMELVEAGEIPVEFYEKFPNGSIYEKLTARETKGKVDLYCSFDTDTEEDFDEYTDPSISLLVEY